MILDYEGSELNIIKDLGTYPDTIIIGTYPEYQASTDSTIHALPDDYATTMVDYHPDFPEKDVVRDESHQRTT